MKNTIKDLEKKSIIIRRNILKSIGINKKSHLGGSMSAADIVTALYFYKMNHNPVDPNYPDRDRFIFSKGHSVLAQYAALAEAGYFSRNELEKTKTLGSILQGHPEIRTPGIEANTGSLGQGLSIGLGMALAARLDKRAYRVYVILGDGELAEGQIWEAVTAASNFKANNLIAIIDYNKVQATGPIDRYDQGDIKAKFKAAGWEVFEIDGHDMEQIVHSLDAADEIEGRPSVIIAHTIKGKGISFAENKASYHNSELTEEEYKQAVEEIAKLHTEVERK